MAVQVQHVNRSSHAMLSPLTAKPVQVGGVPLMAVPDVQLVLEDGEELGREGVLVQVPQRVQEREVAVEGGLLAQQGEHEAQGMRPAVRVHHWKTGARK